jgi:hypothetical protein
MHSIYSALSYSDRPCDVSEPNRGALDGCRDRGVKLEPSLAHLQFAACILHYNYDKVRVGQVG